MKFSANPSFYMPLLKQVVSCVFFSASKLPEELKKLQGVIKEPIIKWIAEKDVIGGSIFGWNVTEKDNKRKLELEVWIL